MKSNNRGNELTDFYESNNLNSKHRSLHSFIRSLFIFFKDLVMVPQSQTRRAPFIRSSASIKGLLNNFIIASIPCWLIGLWNLGYQINITMAEFRLTVLSGWQGNFLSFIGINHDPANIVACFSLGLLYFLPILLTSLIVVLSWEWLFSTIRRRPISEGLLVFAWFFTLIMPAGIDLFKVCLGVSFGYVIGSAIFGGYGRYLINPVLLSAVFLLFAYPDLVFIAGNWVPVTAAEKTLPLELVAIGGLNAVQAAGYTWWELFLGMRPGPIGSVSVLGCMLGALYLVITGSASWRIIIGALIGMTLSVVVYTELFNEVNLMTSASSYWHVVLGAFAFGVVFFATDPVAAASTSGGRWFFGLLVGMLTVIIRVSNPTYNEGILFALLLASMLSPIIDFCCIELNVRRRKLKLQGVNNG